MAWDGGHPDLVVGDDRLHGRPADKAGNAGYLQTGKPGGTGLEPVYRRKVAAALRNCVVWPHVQTMVLDLVALREWSTPAAKLANWQAAPATTVDPCPSLAKRLKNQQPAAETVYEQIGRLLG